jgi:phage-related protein
MARVQADEIRSPKPIFWVSSSKKELQSFPKPARRAIGQALYDAQTGGKHPDAKPLKGFGGAGVLEIVEDDDGSTYRAIYTVKFADVIYVLNAFQKKSKSGTKTPAHEIDKVKRRLRDAKAHYAEWLKKQDRKEQDRP